MNELRLNVTLCY